MDKREDLEIIEDVNPVNNIQEPTNSVAESVPTPIVEIDNSNIQPVENVEPVGLVENVETIESNIVEPKLEPEVNNLNTQPIENIEANTIEDNIISTPTVEPVTVNVEEVSVEVMDEIATPVTQAPEVLNIEEDNKKPEIVKEQVMTEEQKEEKQNKSGMTLVIVILLILILFVLFLPQISEMLAK